MGTLDIIKNLENAADRNARDHVLIAAFEAGDRQFFAGAQMALDKLIDFHVRKVPLIEDGEDADEHDFSFADFLELAGQLRRRELIDDAIAEALADVAQRAPIELWNRFYRRILLKDLRLGVTEAGMNRVLRRLMATHEDAAQFLVPSYACQMAQDGDSVDAQMGVKLLDAKLSGVRTLAILDKDQGVTLLDRKGNWIRLLPEIDVHLRAMLDRLPGSLVLDGVLQHPEGKEALQRLLKRPGLHGVVRYAIFDLVPLGAFKTGFCATPQCERHVALASLEMSGMLAETTGGRIFVPPKRMVDLNTEDGRVSYAEFAEHVAQQGVKTVIVKDAEAPYMGRKSGAWVTIPIASA